MVENRGTFWAAFPRNFGTRSVPMVETMAICPPKRKVGSIWISNESRSSSSQLKSSSKPWGICVKAEMTAKIRKRAGSRGNDTARLRAQHDFSTSSLVPIRQYPSTNHPPQANRTRLVQSPRGIDCKTRQSCSGILRVNLSGRQHLTQPCCTIPEPVIQPLPLLPCLHHQRPS
jgi:hypothetical protein